MSNTLRTKDLSKRILFLEPAFSHNIWGGKRLSEEFGYNIEGEDIGECWGISAYPGHESTLKDCEGNILTLSQLFFDHPECFGGITSPKFPLLTKIIDAKDLLSIQVHPDDDYAREYENGSFGKTECWYILDCPKEEPYLVIGHNAGSKAELVDMIDNKQWKYFIREIPVKKGDLIQIDPGTVHAIKGGFLILETQQNSDITYRVYDYDRLSNGKPRQLHIKQSIECITVPAKPVDDIITDTNGLAPNQMHKLLENKYYSIFKLIVEGNCTVDREYPFLLGTVIEGSGTISGNNVQKGQHFIVPSGVPEIELSGKMEIIFSTN